jgi:uncharacterized membrane protein
MEFWEKLVALWERRNYRTIGLLSGILVGILYLFVGFWHTLVFLFIVFSGWYLGKALDERETWRDVLERLIPNMNKYRD